MSDSDAADAHLRALVDRAGAGWPLWLLVSLCIAGLTPRSRATITGAKAARSLLSIAVATLPMIILPHLAGSIG